MSYDPQGNHSLPAGTIVNTGDKILPSQHNPAMQDISDALSAVLIRDGRAGMVGPLPMGGFPIQNMLDGTNTTDGATVGQVANIYGSQIGAADSKATPVDADYLPLYDSAAANALRKLTWANVKATLKAYFDTLYAGASAALLKAGGTMTGDLTLKGNPTSNLMAATKQYVDALPIQKSYESAEQVPTENGSYTLAHGMGVEPKIVQIVWVCKTAEYGYAVGDRLVVNPGSNSTAGSTGLLSLRINATNIRISYGSMYTTRLDTHAAQRLSDANWRLIVRAYA